jgi:hypothetical protein
MRSEYRSVSAEIENFSQTFPIFILAPALTSVAPGVDSRSRGLNRQTVGLEIGNNPHSTEMAFLAFHRCRSGKSVGSGSFSKASDIRLEKQVNASLNSLMG